MHLLHISSQDYNLQKNIGTYIHIEKIKKFLSCAISKSKNYSTKYIFFLQLPQNHIVLVLHIVAAIIIISSNNITRHLHHRHRHRHQIMVSVSTRSGVGVFIVLPIFSTLPVYTTIFLVATILIRRLSIMARMPSNLLPHFLFISIRIKLATLLQQILQSIVQFWWLIFCF